jgi:hypothetical protein
MSLQGGKSDPLPEKEKSTSFQFSIEGGTKCNFPSAPPGPQKLKSICLLTYTEFGLMTHTLVPNSPFFCLFFPFLHGSSSEFPKQD